MSEDSLDAVFRAMADPSRRLLLDRLFERDGQAQAELIDGLPMSRIGAMKHLRVLEAAGLVTAVKVGRQKRHYLNPVPIRMIHDRWVSKYAEPWAAGLAALKAGLEEITMAEAPRHVYVVYIRTSPERLWRALTDSSDTLRYYYHSTVASDWQPGSSIVYSIDGVPQIEGTILEADPPRRLVSTFRMLWEPSVAGAPGSEPAQEPPSRVTREIEPFGPACRLTVTHDGFAGETVTYREVAGGWPLILSGLKTLLETDEPLVVEGPIESAV